MCGQSLSFALPPFAMNIVIDPTSWMHAAMGGALIGLASALLLWLNGAIAGISGVFGSLFLGKHSGGERIWRLAFIGGLLLGAAAFAWLNNGLSMTPQTGALGMVLGGIAVGLGTRLGSGCTSGHGVCGLANFSGRSFTAVLTFMGSAAVTVLLLKLLGTSA